jgi:hypothetical protein
MEYNLLLILAPLLGRAAAVVVQIVVVHIRRTHCSYLL